MRAAKRQWIYAGLAVPQGVALVGHARTRPQKRSARRILLVGDDHARGIATPLADLSVGSGTTLVVRSRKSSQAADWLTDELFWTGLSSIRPDAVLFSLDAADGASAAALARRAGRSVAVVRWLPPPGRRVEGLPSVPAPLWLLRPEQRMSVGRYAAWAAAIWRSLT